MLKLRSNLCVQTWKVVKIIETRGAIQSLCTYLASCEESCASLVTAGKILSVRSFPPERRRTAPTFSTRLDRCWAVHFLTTALRWLSAERKPIQQSNIQIFFKVSGVGEKSKCMHKSLVKQQFAVCMYVCILTWVLQWVEHWCYEWECSAAPCSQVLHQHPAWWRHYSPQPSAVKL